MALVFCSVCGKEISQEAKSCPHCGHPQPSVKTKTGFPWKTTIFSILLLASIGRSIQSCAKTKEDADNFNKLFPPPTASTTPSPSPSSTTSQAPPKTTEQRLPAIMQGRPEPLVPDEPGFEAGGFFTHHCASGTSPSCILGVCEVINHTGATVNKMVVMYRMRDDKIEETKQTLVTLTPEKPETVSGEMTWPETGQPTFGCTTRDPPKEETP